jgi:hypothetical protein
MGLGRCFRWGFRYRRSCWVGPEQDAINANHAVALQKAGESAGLRTGRRYFRGVGRYGPSGAPVCGNGRGRGDRLRGHAGVDSGELMTREVGRAPRRLENLAAFVPGNRNGREPCASA